MVSENIDFISSDGKKILGYKWSSRDKAAKGVVLIVHGMAETAVRYQRFAERLCHEGYLVYTYDQRGHGRTAGSLENVGILADKDSLDILVEDLHQFNGIIHNDNPQLPVFLFAHSMGSFVGQRYIQLYGNTIKGVILSGTNGKQGFILKVASKIAKKEVLTNGREAKSPKMDNLSFGSYNKAFKPNRTNFDWLNRDNNEVDKYINDPYCGDVFSAGFYYDMTLFLKKIEQTDNLKKIPLELPIFLVSGAKDPVGKAGKGVISLYRSYLKIGIKDLHYQLYKDARHEILNETNRDQVMTDIEGWIKKHM